MAPREQAILMVRLGAMGDIIHALPAAASLKLSFPKKRVVWVVARKWMPLLEGNPHLDAVIPFARRSVADVSATWKLLGALKPELAIDFQGLVQSAIAGRVARPGEFIGLTARLAREKAAAFFYTKTVDAEGPHRVERCLQLAAAAGATTLTKEAWLPAGRVEGALPPGPFVLANPFAGWVSKQWPIENYLRLSELLAKQGVDLVVNVPESRSEELKAFKSLRIHSSSIAGLIHATRCATAVIGVDSGPLHMAAALKKPGVAIYGPTDPAQTGPFESLMPIMRAETPPTYKRDDEIHPAMRRITPDQVLLQLNQSMALVSC